MAQADRLFQAFQRFHHDDQFEGSGVGLSIVQRIVKRHGGRIWAQAAPGKGASFFFTLAATPSSTSETMPRPE
jgi:signal transduction histidine kinase